MLNQPVLPDIVREWVRVNPFPVLLITDSLDSLLQNDAFASVLQETAATSREFLLKKFGDKITGLLQGPLGTTTSITTPVSLPDGHLYDLYVTRISDLDAGVSCCILIPEKQTSKALMSDILNSVDCPLILIDEEGNVLYHNSLMTVQLGGSDEQPLSITHLRDIEYEYSDATHRDRIALARAGNHRRHRSRLKHRDGSAIAVELTVISSLLRGAGNFMVTARVSTETDLTGEDANGSADGEDGSASGSPPGQRDPAIALLLSSPELREVLRKVEQVAPTEVTVLIEGEIGTEKPTVAAYIHELSLRASAPYETVNCLELPAELIESELFGYPKGAFTGAYRNRPGRLRAADGGTLFLRGIDRISGALQTRLLQFLESGEFLPTNEARTQKSNVRLISSSTVNLQDAVKRGKFQEPLLSAIASLRIRVPALRDRPGDIGRLTTLCIDRFNVKFNKSISGIDDSTLYRLENYSFPGNDCELSEMIERAFIVSSGRKLPLHIPDEESPPVIPRPVLDVFDGRLTEFLSLEEFQRKYIQLVLKSTQGKVSGKNGAAEILKVHPQTLFSKMKRLGIKR